MMKEQPHIMRYRMSAYDLIGLIELAGDKGANVEHSIAC